MFLFRSYLLIFFPRLIFLPILIYWCRGVIQFTLDYVFECTIFFHENTIIVSNKAFNTCVFKSIIRVKCLSSHKIFLHIRSSISRTLSMVYFERPYMSHHLSNLFVVSFDVIIINYKSNLLWKTCLDVTFHVVFCYILSRY